MHLETTRYTRLFSTKDKATNDIIVKETVSQPKAMQTQMFKVGPFSTNCYIVGCKQTRVAVIIDPGFDRALETEKALNYIDSRYA